jgi:hypothetical protein
MPQMMPEGLPERTTWSRYDFTKWADGKAWKFVRGEDYESSTESFRYNVKRWAKSHGFDAEVRTLPAIDKQGRPVPATKSDPIGLGVCFTPAGRTGRRADPGSASAA